MKIINSFSGEHRFLSNFWYADVMLSGLAYPTTEHAFQAAKTRDIGERKEIQGALTPGNAKRLGRAVTMRTDWDFIKLHVMLDVTRKKYAHPALRKQLIATGNAVLVEGNDWGDTYWGVCNGAGTNWLGKVLMCVRDELRADPNNAELVANYGQY